MGLAGQNQVRQMYVGLTYPGHANVAAVKAGANGALAILSADGSAVGAGKKFVFMQKSNKGTLITSDIVDPKNVTLSKSRAYSAQVLGVTTISGITVNANTLYTIEIAIKDFGSLSAENEYIKKAFYKAAAGNTAEHIVDGLVQALARNFKREEPVTSATSAYTLASTAVIQIPTNPYFTFAKTGTGAGAALVITERNAWVGLSYSLGRNTSTSMPFAVNAKFTTLPTFTVVAQKPAVGDGYSIADMEWYLKGERNDVYRTQGTPHHFEGSYDAVLSNTYNIIEIGYFSLGRDEAKQSKKSITIALPALGVPNTQVNAMIANLNTILGAGSVVAFPAA
jgi:hypothetical protein